MCVCILGIDHHHHHASNNTNTPPPKNERQTYEETLLELWDYAQAQGIPFRSLQLDSWWYYKVGRAYFFWDVVYGWEKREGGCLYMH